MAAVFALVGSAGEARAQPVVAVKAAGLLSIQPGDDAYVGSPYLDEALGGLAPGVLVGVSVRAGRRGVLAGEYSQGWLTRELEGRLVRVVFGPFGFTTPPTDASLPDRLLSGLGGVVVRGGGLAYEVLGGVSWRLDDPTLDGMSTAGEGRPDDDLRRLGLTVGFDVSSSGTRRVAPYATVRYTWLDRRVREQELGIGPHVFRIGAGVRVALDASRGRGTSAIGCGPCLTSCMPNRSSR